MEAITAQEKYPEYDLIPTTYYKYKNVKIFFFARRFDYVQDLARKGGNESFHILYKDGKFGVLMHQASCLWTTSKVALPARYDYKIEFADRKNKSFIAIVRQGDMYGLCLWEKKLFGVNKYFVPVVYDSFVFESDKKRFKAEKEGKVVFFDMTGHILK